MYVVLGRPLLLQRRPTLCKHSIAPVRCAATLSVINALAMPTCAVIVKRINRATDTDEVQTGLVCLRDLVFYKPTARTACLEAVLRFTSHKNAEVKKDSMFKLVNYQASSSSGLFACFR
jgi:hypothetical protein